VGGLFSLETIFYVVQKFLILCRPISPIFLSCWAVGVTLRKFMPVAITSTVFHALSCTNFSFRSDIKVLDPFWNDTSRIINRDLVSIFFQTDNHFSQQHLLKSLPFLHSMFWAPFSKISWSKLYGFISSSSILFHWSSGLFLCQYHAVFIVIAL
jgi:hypothetical protein